MISERSLGPTTFEILAEKLSCFLKNRRDSFLILYQITIDFYLTICHNIGFDCVLQKNFGPIVCSHDISNEFGVLSKIRSVVMFLDCF